MTASAAVHLAGACPFFLYDGRSKMADDKSKPEARMNEEAGPTELADGALDQVAGSGGTLTTAVPSKSTTTTTTKSDGTFTRTDGTTGLAADVNFGSAV
jgi:hypothetical protein